MNEQTSISVDNATENIVAEIINAPEPETKAVKTAKTKPTEAEFLATREKEIRKKHRRVLENSIRRETDGSHAGKLTVEMNCQASGCDKTRRVATSDLFQVRLCADCTIEARNKKRRKKAAELKSPKDVPAKKNKKSRKKAEPALSFAEANGLAHGNEELDDLAGQVNEIREMAELPTTQVEDADEPETAETINS